MYVNIKRNHIEIWSAILVVLTLAIMNIAFETNKVKYGKKLIADDNVLNISTYYTEYEATVISNKNTNTYFVKEWYIESVGSKIEYLDYMGNIVSVITTPEASYISNSGNNAYLLNNNINLPENVLSLSTFVNIFNNDIACSCTKNVYEKNAEINIVYNICGNEKCMQKDSLKHMGVTGFELNVKDNIPSVYTIYTANKKEYACIVYNKFDTNILIEDSIFDISK